LIIKLRGLWFSQRSTLSLQCATAWAAFTLACCCLCYDLRYGGLTQGKREKN